MRVDEIVGVFASIVVLAMLSIAIVNGDKTAKVIGSIGSAFSGSIKAATLKG